MIESLHELVRQLRASGALADGPPYEPSQAPVLERPWYIGFLLGAAGWLAGLFVLILVVMLVEPKSKGAALTTGLILLGAAWGLFKADREGAFFSQLALALSVAGQFAALVGIVDLFSGSLREVAGIALGALLLQLALIFAMPNRLHRTMSTLFACMAWALLVRYGLWDQDPFHSGSTPPAPSFGLALAGWAIAWLPIAGVLFQLARREPAWMAAGLQEIARPAVVGLILGLALTTLFSQPLESFPWHRAQAYGGLSIWPLLSAAGALAALAGAFAMGHRGLAAVCIVAALLHMSHFYYALGTPLLMKSLTMIALGVLLLASARQIKAGRPSA